MTGKRHVAIIIGDARLDYADINVAIYLNSLFTDCLKKVLLIATAHDVFDSTTCYANSSGRNRSIADVHHRASPFKVAVVLPDGPHAGFRAS